MTTNDFGAAEAAIARLAQNAPLSAVLDTAGATGTTDPAVWIALDADVRQVSYYRAELMPTRAEVGALTEPRLVLALCHPDGKIREAAVRRAERYPALLPLIAVRCADWAEPVRELARGVLRESLARLDTEQTAALVPLLLRLGRRDRGAYGVEALTETLHRAPQERLTPLLADSDRTVRRFGHRIAVAEHTLSPGELARIAARDDDFVVQNLCADAALADVQPDAYDDVLTPLLTARSPRARSAGVTALRRAGRPDTARPFLTDRSALVRACARYVLQQYGTDPLPLYREWLADPGDPVLSPGAAIGLAECGTRADAALLWPLIGHATPAVRARAVAGLRALDVAVTERLRVLLDDPAPAVAREAATALLPSARQVPVEWLLLRIRQDRPRHTRVAAFRLLCAQGGSARLSAARALSDDADVKLRSRAEQALRR